MACSRRRWSISMVIAVILASAFIALPPQSSRLAATVISPTSTPFPPLPGIQQGVARTFRSVGTESGGLIMLSSYVLKRDFSESLATSGESGNLVSREIGRVFGQDLRTFIAPATLSLGDFQAVDSPQIRRVTLAHVAESDDGQITVATLVVVDGPYVYGFALGANGVEPLVELMVIATRVLDTPERGGEIWPGYRTDGLWSRLPGPAHLPPGLSPHREWELVAEPGTVREIPASKFSLAEVIAALEGVELDVVVEPGAKRFTEMTVPGQQLTIEGTSAWVFFYPNTESATSFANAARKDPERILPTPSGGEVTTGSPIVIHYANVVITVSDGSGDLGAQIGLALGQLGGASAPTPGPRSASRGTSTPTDCSAISAYQQQVEDVTTSVLATEQLPFDETLSNISSADWRQRSDALNRIAERIELIEPPLVMEELHRARLHTMRLLIRLFQDAAEDGLFSLLGRIAELDEATARIETAEQEVRAKCPIEFERYVASKEPSRQSPTPSSLQGDSSPTPDQATVNVGSVVWATSIDSESNAPLNQVEVFPAEARIIYATLPVSRLRQGTTVTASWSYNGVPLDRFNRLLTVDVETENVWMEFHITRVASEPWPPGIYEVTVSVDSELAQTAQVSVEAEP